MRKEDAAALSETCCVYKRLYWISFGIYLLERLKRLHCWVHVKLVMVMSQDFHNWRARKEIGDIELRCFCSESLRWAQFAQKVCSSQLINVKVISTMPEVSDRINPLSI